MSFVALGLNGLSATRIPGNIKYNINDIISLFERLGKEEISTNVSELTMSVSSST